VNNLGPILAACLFVLAAASLVTAPWLASLGPLPWWSGLALALSLAAVAITLARIFSGNPKSLPDQPLGLPAGSIRALMGLALVAGFLGVLFVIVVGNPGSQLQTLRDQTALEAASIPRQDLVFVQTRDSEGQIRQVPAPEWRVPGWPSDTSLTYDLVMARPMLLEDNKLVDTMVSTLMTLLTAVIAFYFGSKAISSPGGPGAAPKAAALRPTVLYKGPGKAEALVLEGTNLGEVASVRLKDAAGSLVPTEAKVQAA